MIAPSDFIDSAPLSVGEQTHINHVGCSAGTDTKKRLYIKRNENNIVAYCHHCTQYGIVHTHSGYVRPLSVLKKLFNKDETIYVKDVHFPKDTEWDAKKWPVAAWKWLTQYNITVTLAEKHMIGYSPSLDRVILPVYDDKGILLFWQGRALDKRVTPKYMAVSAAKKPYMFLRTDKECTKWVIVEDVLSAIKCSEYVNAVALLGTASTNEITITLKREGATDIYLWFDNDSAGWSGRHKAHKMLSLVFDESQIKNVPLLVQPKEATAAQLIEEFTK